MDEGYAVEIQQHMDEEGEDEESHNVPTKLATFWLEALFEGREDNSRLASSAKAR